MPGTKRKASFATPYERPAKLNKQSTSATISDTLERRSTRATRRPELLTLRSAKKGTVELAAASPTSTSSSSCGEIGSPTPSLRRASTLTLEDEAKSTLPKRSSSKSMKSSAPSLERKCSSVVDAEGLVTKLSGLKSGSIIGETTTLAESTITKKPSSSKKLSKKSSTTASKDRLSVPSGLTKLALSTSGSKSSLRVSKSSLVGTIEDSEMTTALATLRHELSYNKEVAATASADTSKPGDKESAEVLEAAGTAGETSTMLPPGGLVEVAISFDTTGSMYGCLKEVRSKIQDLIQRLQADIPGIRICVMAHGDYCDADKYIVKWIDFGATLPEICKFVSEVDGTFGGDGPECYELVLKRTREALAWTPGSQRVLIMIGDDEPHPVGYRHGGKTYNIDWREECALLKEMNVKVYGVQAGSNTNSERFFKEMSTLTLGKYLPLANFTSMFDFLMMICYREGNPEMMAVYEHEVRNRHVGGGMAKDLADLVLTFTGSSSDDTPTLATGKGAAKKVPTVKANPHKVTKATKPVKATPSKKPKVTKAGKSPKITKVPRVATVPKTKKVHASKTAAATNKSAPKHAKTSVKNIKGDRKRLSKKTGSEKLLRENLSDGKLIGGALKKLQWTAWEPFITQQKIAGKDLRKCQHMFGYRRHTMFNSDSKTPAIYEISVQLPGKGKKYATYFRKSTGFTKKSRWDVYLLRHKTVRTEVATLFAKGCNFFCRRGVPTAKTRAAQVKQVWAANVHLRTKVDYAWRKYLYGKKKHRKVIRNKIEISSDTI